MRRASTPRIVATYLRIGDDPELSRGLRFAGQSPIGDLGGPADGGTGRDPVADIVRDDLDQTYSGIVLGAIVCAVFEIAEE